MTRRAVNETDGCDVTRCPMGWNVKDQFGKFCDAHRDCDGWSPSYSAAYYDGWEDVPCDNCGKPESAHPDAEEMDGTPCCRAVVTSGDSSCHEPGCYNERTS